MRRRRAIITCLSVLFTLSALGQNWDINTLHKINSLDGRFVRNYSKVFSHSAPYLSIGVPVAMAAYAGLSKDKGLLQDALYIGTSVIEATVLTYGLKYAVDRTRPYDRYPGRVHACSTESSPSFPSGHTAAAFSLATSLSLRYPKWYVIAPSAFWACSVGFARMNEGVHYPSDVIAGAAIGAGCAVANVYVNRWLNRWLFGKPATSSAHVK
ncbi:MAG: phosphatase PAP2 family protein [Bacteroides sp.]